jgi:phosphoserine phosphatase
MNTGLTSWRDTPAKKVIEEFVSMVTDASNEAFVPLKERIAVFDNDGTLWCEKPGYIQLFFAIARLKEMAEADPTLLGKPAFRAAATNDAGYFASLYPDDVPALMQIVFDTHAGMPQREFEQMAYYYLSHARHPRFHVPYKQCVYQPMVELMGYLDGHGFKVFITSAGGMTFVRTVAEEIYGVLRENVIGSNTTFEVGRRDGRLVLMRKPGLVQPPDDGPGKPVNIELHIGRPPIMAVGNANGDIEMLEFAHAGRGNPLNMLVHHDDAEREYAYDQGAEKAIQMAKHQGWHLISMKNDWQTVFGFQQVG